MLRGSHTASVDSKGRLKIPSAFKNVLEENFGPDFFVTSLDGQFAVIYPLEEWKKIEQKLEAATSSATRKYMRWANRWGHSARIDAQGRIMLPSPLREEAGLRGEVTMLGTLTNLEIWNTSRFEQYMETHPITVGDVHDFDLLKI